MDNVEDFVTVFRFLFFVLLFLIPGKFHSYLFSVANLCYIYQQLPFDASNGRLDINTLDQLNWNFLPIKDLWPQIRDNKFVRNQLLDHCHEISLPQLLWIAENDPTNRLILLKNEACMSQIQFQGLQLNEFKSFLPEISIFSMNPLDELDEVIIIEGLVRENFIFPNYSVHREFLLKLPEYFLQSTQLFNYSNAVNLFNVNCFLVSEHCHSSINSSSRLNSSILDIALIKKLITFLFRGAFVWEQSNFRIHLSELKDFLETFPQLCTNALQRCQEIHSFNPILDPGNDNLKLFLDALQSRNHLFFINPEILNVLNLIKIGPFDQYRILLIILPNHLETFNSFFNAELFDNWLLSHFFYNYPSIYESIIAKTSLNIYSIPLIKLLVLKPIFYFNPKAPATQLMPQVSSFRDNFNLLPAIISRDAKISEAFIHPKFSLKFREDAVIDHGGPLLDWITGILQLFVDLNLFNKSLENDFDAEAYNFLDPDFFRILGLLHGKLLQLGSGPLWVPVIRDNLVLNLSSILAMNSNPSEAVALFNDFGFPILDNKIKGNKRVSSMDEIKNYYLQLNFKFSDWKSKAWHEYYTALKLIIINHVSPEIIRRLLLPIIPLDPLNIHSASKIFHNFSLFSCDISELWLQILSSLTCSELEKLLIFITGQCRIVSIQVNFVLLDEGQASRLPQSKTCTREIFIFCHEEQDLTALVLKLTALLQTSILNYQGFGNV